VPRGRVQGRGRYTLFSQQRVITPGGGGGKRNRGRQLGALSIHSLMRSEKTFSAIRIGGPTIVSGLKKGRGTARICRLPKEKFSSKAYHEETVRLLQPWGGRDVCWDLLSFGQRTRNLNFFKSKRSFAICNRGKKKISLSNEFFRRRPEGRNTRFPFEPKRENLGERT